MAQKDSEDVFKKLDLDGSGTLERSELVHNARTNQLLPEDEEQFVNNFLQRYDTDGDG